MYLCVCKGIKESDVEDLGRAGITCPKQLAATLGIDDDDACGRCLDKIHDLVTIASSEHKRHCTSVQATSVQS